MWLLEWSVLVVTNDLPMINAASVDSTGFYSRIKLSAMDCARVKVIVHGGLLIL
jgi:hypothetical protein